MVFFWFGTFGYQLYILCLTFQYRGLAPHKNYFKKIHKMTNVMIVAVFAMTVGRSHGAQCSADEGNGGDLVEVEKRWGD